MRKCGGPRRVDSRETATARSHGGPLFREPLGISSRQEVFEPNQVGLKAIVRAVARWWLWSVGALTTPRLSQLGWQCSARGGVT